MYKVVSLVLQIGSILSIIARRLDLTGGTYCHVVSLFPNYNISGNVTRVVTSHASKLYDFTALLRHFLRSATVRWHCLLQAVSSTVS
jgi:hypothetical protein